MRPIDADALALETKRWFVIPDNRETMKAAIDHAETLDYVPRQQWISVEDRLPEEETEVLCYLGNALGKGIVVAFRRHGDWYFDGWKCPTVTHWMPLPEPPKEES